MSCAGDFSQNFYWITWQHVCHLREALCEPFTEPRGKTSFDSMCCASLLLDYVEAELQYRSFGKPFLSPQKASTILKDAIMKTLLDWSKPTICVIYRKSFARSALCLQIFRMRGIPVKSFTVPDFKQFLCVVSLSMIAFFCLLFFRPSWFQTLLIHGLPMIAFCSPWPHRSILDLFGAVLSLEMGICPEDFRVAR